MTDADKRDKIIAAAYAVLSEKGYDKASTKEIAKSAGVAQGLINYYFSSKDLLFVEVFRRQTEIFCASFDKLTEKLAEKHDSSELNAERISRMLDVSKKMVLEDQDWIRLKYELYAIGLRNEAVRGTLKEMLAIERNHISHRVREISGLSAEQTEIFSSISYAIFEGLGLQKAADPDFKYDEAHAMAAEMYGAFYAFLMKKRES